MNTAYKRQRNTRGVAAEVCYTKLGRALISYFRANLRCDEEAQDLAQEVYVRVLRLAHPDLVQSPRAMVFKIAQNLLRDRARRSATKLAASTVSYDGITMVAEAGNPIDQVQTEQLLGKVVTVIEGLSPNCRRAFELNRIDQLGYRSIASEMGISVSMVEKHISAALSALRYQVSI